MKTNLLKIFLLLTGILYLTTALELDSKELEQNYENENHSYVLKSQNYPDFQLEQVVDNSPTILHNIDSRKFVITNQFCGIVFSYPSPPDKIYLWICSFLI